jgi:hypothetical protein
MEKVAAGDLVKSPAATFSISLCSNASGFRIVILIIYPINIIIVC